MVIEMRLVRYIAVLAVTALAGAAALAEAATPPASYMLTVKFAGRGSGVIHPSLLSCTDSNGKPTGPCEVAESSGNSVTLTANADTGSVFVGWSGDGCSGTGSCKVVFNRNVTVTARFTLSSVSTRGGTLHVSPSSRTTSLPMTCHGGSPCSGTMTVNSTLKGKQKLGSGTYNIRANSRGDATLKLSSSSLSLIGKSDRGLRAKVTIVPNNGGPYVYKILRLKLA
jgi:Divergent InlB B-repeat domain